MAVMVSLLMGICMTIGVLLRYIPFAPVLNPRQKRVLYISYAATSMSQTLFMILLFSKIGTDNALHYLVGGGTAHAIIVQIINLVVIRGRIKEHLFVFGVVTSIHILMLSVPAFVESLMTDLSDMEALLRMIMYTVMLGATYVPMRKLLRYSVEPFLYLKRGSYRQTILFIPIFFFVAMMFIQRSSKEADSTLQLISSLFSTGMLVGMCLSIGKDHGREHKYQMMEEQLAAQRVHYTELKTRVEEARKTAHDMKHHIAAIRHFMDTDDKEGLRRYCDDLVGRNGSESRIPYSGNVAADGILYHYQQKALQADISFQYSGTIHSHGIADVDLCVLLGNALDNALTGCMTVEEDRKITVIGQSEAQMLSIVVRNTFDGEVQEEDNVLLSRKRHYEPGVGISSMKSVCSRYGGTMEVSWDDRFFTVIFMLPRTEE